MDKWNSETLKPEALVRTRNEDALKPLLDRLRGRAAFGSDHANVPDVND